jgi:hypothetical protein
MSIDSIKLFLNNDKKIILLDKIINQDFILNEIVPFIIENNPNKKMAIATGTKENKNIIIKTLKSVLGDYKVDESNMILPNGFSIYFHTAYSNTPVGSCFDFIIFSDYIADMFVNSKVMMSLAFDKFESLISRANIKPKIIVYNQKLDTDDLQNKIANDFKDNKYLARVKMV